VLPPKVAPVPAVLVPIYRKDEERAVVMEAARKLASHPGIKIDDREGQTPGAKFFHWERRGVPVVIELGPRDVAAGQAVLKRRDTGTKQTVPLEAVGASLETLLETMQRDVYQSAKERLRANCVLANSIAEVEDILRAVTAEKGGGKFVMAHVKDDPRSDVRLKEFKATVRCVPLLDEYDGAGTCIITGERVEQRSVIAKAY
jgi:prolyl-tRNA synthetase